MGFLVHWCLPLHQRTFAEPSLWRPALPLPLSSLSPGRSVGNKQQCAGIHRSLGTHISKVKSATLDKWTDEQIDVRWSLLYNNKYINIYKFIEINKQYILLLLILLVLFMYLF